MSRDKEILSMVLLLGSIAGGLLYLAIWFPLPVGGRQALLLVVGMLFMATLSALSAYISLIPFAHNAILPGEFDFSRQVDSEFYGQQESYAQNQARIELEAVITKIHGQMKSLNYLLKDESENYGSSFVALAANLRCNDIIDERTFQDIMYFRNAYIDLKKNLPIDNNFVDLTTGFGNRVLLQLYSLTPITASTGANEPVRAQTRRNSESKVHHP